MSARNIERLFILAICITLMALCSAVQAQRLYDKNKDEKAQQALKQAEEVTSAALFETLLKNLTALEAQDLAMVMRNSQRSTRTAINGFMTWGTVLTRIDGIKKNLERADTSAQQRNRTLADAKADIDRQLAGARAELAELRKNANDVEDESLAAQFAGLSGLESTEALITDLSQATGATGTKIEALDKAQKIVSELADLFKKVNDRVKAIQDLKDQLAGFDEALQKIALQSLELEADHLKMQIAIETRRGIELADARTLIPEFDKDIELLSSRYYGHCFNLSKPVDIKRETIVDTFDKARQMAPCKRDSDNPLLPATENGRQAVAQIMLNLFRATTIVSRVQLSSDLARLRAAQEEHRYSLRRRALQASAYELTLTAGAQRLSLFYKGGIKPSQIAQLIYNVANITTPIAIFAK